MTCGFLNNRRGLSLLVAPYMILLAGFLMPYATLDAASAGDEVLLVRFTKKAGTGEPDPYVEKVMRVAMDMLRDELRSARDVDWVHYVEEPAPTGGGSRRIAREAGARYLVSGTFEQLRGNVSIEAEWFDLETERRGRRSTFLGEEELENFNFIASRMAELAEWIHEDRRREAPREIKTVRVSCFTGAGKSQFSFLDRFVTLELPQFLGPALTAQGISPDRIRVIGLSFDEYEGRCGDWRSAGTADGLAPSGISGGVRYEISGTIAPLGKTVTVETLVYGGPGSRPVSIGTFQSRVRKEFRNIPRQLAETLGPTLKTFLVQDRLNAGGFGLLEVSGEANEDMRIAVEKLQRDSNLLVTGTIDDDVLKILGLRRVL